MDQGYADYGFAQIKPRQMDYAKASDFQRIMRQQVAYRLFKKGRPFSYLIEYYLQIKVFSSATT